MAIDWNVILLVLLVCIALAIIGLVLIQQGKGADAGASFGGGASQTVFGSAGSGNFLTKSTWFLAATFFVICVALAYIARNQSGAGDIDFAEPTATEVTAPQSDVPQYEEEASVGGDVPSVPDSAGETNSAPSDVPQEPATAAPEDAESASEQLR
ncbi:MAG: preprotein translocase subunit SecG [Pseudomonadales bacterium]|nr:preprotein translocase subunit SecG [Pseudomonadales bacterium]